MKEYRTDGDIEELIGAFEAGTISRADWKHAEHLIVALYYLDGHDLETATAKMRAGIFNLLKAFKVDLTKEMPYHETLTVFWMRTLATFNASRKGTPMVRKVHEMTAIFDKEYTARFYSRDLLFSDKARSEFVEPDLRPISPLPKPLP